MRVLMSCDIPRMCVKALCFKSARSVGLVFGFAKHLYERLPDVQAFSALTDRWVAALYPAFDAACLATAGPDEIRGLTPHS